MKLVFALSTMAILMVADATMYKTTKYAGSTCQGSPIGVEWNMAGVCIDYRAGGMGYIKNSCSGSNAMATGYTDSGCTTVNTTFAIPGLAITAGVLNPGSSCIFKAGETHSSKWSCAGQPSQVKYNFYSDSACTTPGTYGGMSAYKTAIDFCKLMDDEGANKQSELVTVSGDVQTTKSYATSDCTGTETSSETKTMTDCNLVTTGVYWKQDAAGVLTAAQAQAAAPAGPAPAPPGAGTNMTNTTAAPKTTSSGVSLPYSIIASVLSVVASAAVSI